LFLLLGSAIVFGPSPVHAAFKLVDLGTLGGTNSDAEAVNSSGQVTGSSWLQGDNVRHAFLYDGTTMRDLGTLGGPTSVGVGINASGNVVGYGDVLSGASHGFLYSGGGMSDLTAARGDSGSASAINDGDVIVGENVIGNSSDAFVVDDTGFHDLGTGNAFAVNSNGVILGVGVGGGGRMCLALRCNDGPECTVRAVPL
jgi:probable HAF family extracellular repeat protein